MATAQEQVGFVIELAGEGNLMEKALARSALRAKTLEECVGAGFDGERDELRAAMTFSVKSKDGKREIKSMDERGQRKSIETEDTKQYQSFDPEDLKRMGQAYKRVLEVCAKMKAAKDEAGNPMFKAEEIVTELFTPLVREGLMPDNLLKDENSEVARMLREVYKSYREMLRQQKEEAKLARAKLENEFLGGGGKVARLKSLGGKVNASIDSQLSTVASKVGMTPEEFGRARNIASKGMKFGKSLSDAVGKGQALDNKLKGVPDKPEVDNPMTASIDKMMNENIKVSSVVEKLAGALNNLPEGPLKALLSAVESQLMGAAMKLEDLVNANKGEVLSVLRQFAVLIESDGADIARDVATALNDLGSGIKDPVDSGIDRRALDAKVAVAVGKGKLRSGANEMAQGIARELKLALLGQGQSTGLATIVADGFVDQLNTDALVDMLAPALAAKPKPAPNGSAVANVVAKAMTEALAGAHDALKGSGDDLAGGFKNAASGQINSITLQCTTGALADPESLLPSLVPFAKTAATAVFSSETFAKAINSDKFDEVINAKVAEKNKAEAEAELEEMNSEIADFERELVLIDEGGMAMAKQQSLDALIAQMLADEADLQIVLKVGSLLSGAGGSVTTMGANVAVKVGQKAAKKVADSVIPALQAAELVMKMSVTIVKIQKRAQLMRKFKADVELSQKAGSMLLPSIQNFYSSKKQQQVYASIELALQIVQLAGAICSSVPEGITKAVGEALKAAADAAEAGRELAKAIHDEKLLRKGWNITREALSNPANRRAGLDALRHNNTLAVHSVAWAANDGQAMALKIMSSCGVNAQTMADSETDQEKLVEYLETLLSEDLQFKDTEKIKLEWAPSKLELTYPAWYSLKQRAIKKATPAMVDSGTPDIDSGLRTLDSVPSVAASRQSKNPPAIDTVKGYVLDATNLAEAFGKFKPKVGSNATHEDMLALCTKLKAMAEERASELTKFAKELEPV